MRACPILRHLKTTRNAIERGLHGRLPLRLSSLAMPRWKVSVLWVGVGLEGGSRGGLVLKWWWCLWVWLRYGRGREEAE